VFRRSLSLEDALRKDSKVYSGELISLPLTLVEDVLDCLAEVLKIVELEIISDENPSAVRDRCFVCHNRIKQLRQLLQESLEG
jgi:hypothetical protein